MDFKFHLLEKITNNFSDALKVGSGGYGAVYKGVYNGEEIAVKKLHYLQGLDDTEFDNEFRNLSEVKHQNVVRLIGYCYESRHTFVEYKGQLVRAQQPERLLCFEFMQGGSLDEHIVDELCGLDWPVCYNIIKGTCEGLNHLHRREKPIFHLDLKPANILLDKNNKTAKIADLGLSKLVASTKTHQTETAKGSLGYMPPEYVDGGYISKKFDVFSLGVIIIKIMAGKKGYSCCYGPSRMPPEQFIELVCKNWKKRQQATSRYSSHEIDILRVNKCVEIALRCVEADRKKRPCIKDIVHELEKLEAEIEKMSLRSHQSKDLIGQAFKPVKIGPFGAQDGIPWDISHGKVPMHLETISISSTDAPTGKINGLAFSYMGTDKQQDNVSGWGRMSDGINHPISVAEDEYVCEVFGTTDGKGVTSLGVKTTKITHGPFGKEKAGLATGSKDEHFSIPVMQGSIVAFFGRSSDSLNAVGAYVVSSTTLSQKIAFMHMQNLSTSTTSLGPWGSGEDGSPRDITAKPWRLESLTIRHLGVIDQFAFSYIDQAGQKHTAGPWGSGRNSGKFDETIQLGPSEFLKEVSGKVMDDHYNETVISSLTFVTNVQTYGPFGYHPGTRFTANVPENSIVVGFFGRSGHYLNSIGVYTRSTLDS